MDAYMSQIENKLNIDQLLGTKNKCCVPKFATIRIINKWMHI